MKRVQLQLFIIVIHLFYVKSFDILIRNGFDFLGLFGLSIGKQCACLDLVLEGWVCVLEELFF